MSFRASMRRDQRRRLLAFRTRSAAGATAAAASADASAVAGYDDDAHPDRHPALATRLPVSRGRFLVAVLGILAAFGGVIALAVSGPLFGVPLLPEGGRFARTLAVMANAVDPRCPAALQVWLAELALLLAAAVAGAVRFMRRHRRDDYKGRYRAWGWMAVLLTMAAWAGAVPLGQLVAALTSDATGVTAGPGGLGWWVGLAACCFAIVVPWAVLPLRERALTVFWMLASLACWAGAAAAPWAAGWAGGGPRAAVIAQAAWAAGAGLMLIAMLAAARSVIREVRGQCTPASGRTRVGREAVARAEVEAEGTTTSTGGEADDSADEPEARDPGLDGDDFVDGSERGHRRLSKAERKRLRKLARMNGQAA